MAILNFMTSGTYSVIESCHWSKNALATCNLVVYEDDTKQRRLTRIAYELAPQLSTTEIQQYKSKQLTEPPGSPEVGDKYWVPAGATGGWVELAQTHVRWSGSGWEFYNMVNVAIHTFDDEPGVYYRLYNFDWEEDTDGVIANWITNLQMSAMEAAGANPLKQFYLSLHARGEFAGTVSDES